MDEEFRNRVPLIGAHMRAQRQLQTIWAKLNESTVDTDLQMMNRLMRSFYMRLGGDPHDDSAGGAAKELGRLSLAADLAATAVEICAGKVKSFDTKAWREALEAADGILQELDILPETAPLAIKIRDLLDASAVHEASVPHVKEEP